MRTTQPMRPMGAPRGPRHSRLGATAPESHNPDPHRAGRAPQGRAEGRPTTGRTTRPGRGGPVATGASPGPGVAQPRPPQGPAPGRPGPSERPGAQPRPEGTDRGHGNARERARPIWAHMASLGERASPTGNAPERLPALGNALDRRGACSTPNRFSQNRNRSDADSTGCGTRVCHGGELESHWIFDSAG